MKQSDSETESPIPYKYKDADNKVYKDIVLKNDKGELSEDVSQDQSVISKKTKMILYLKRIQKYHQIEKKRKIIIKLL